MTTSLAQRFADSQPQGISNVSRDAAGALVAWVENGCALSVARGSGFVSLTLQIGNARAVQTFYFDSNGLLSSVDGPHIPTILASEVRSSAVTGVGQPTDVVLLQSAQPVTLTGVTTQVVLARKTIPAGMLKINDAILVRYLTKQTNNANTKTVRVFFGSESAHENGVTTASTSNQEVNIYMRGNTSEIAQNAFGGPSFGNGFAGSVPLMITRDITGPVVLDIRAQLANAADSLTLEAFSYILRRGAGTNEA